MNDGTEEVEIMNARIENVKTQTHKEPSNGHELWVDGLLCAFEFIRPRGKGNYTKSGSKMHPIKHTRSQELDNQNQQPAACDNGPVERGEGAYSHCQEPDEINQQSAACQYALFEGSEGGGFVLSIIIGLFGVNLDGIPGGSSTPYAFGLFSAILFLTGTVLIGLGMLCLGLRRPVTEEEINVRKLELQDLVKEFQHDAEAHAKVRQEPKSINRHHLPPAADLLPHDADYILVEQ